MNRLLQACLSSSNAARVPLVWFGKHVSPANRPGFVGIRSNCGVDRLLHLELSSKWKSCYWFNTYSEAEDLLSKTCVPCNAKDISSMSEQSAHELIPKVPGWDLSSEGGTLKLHRSWKVKSFTKGLEFFQLVADVAEAEGHHPDLHLVGWNNVKIEIWTHSVGGLTENDFILAAKINALDIEPLLRRRAAKH
ncbi:uncharacterized protein LOC18442456 [Amborella trichopoda]|uniref:4a-hydroxytetrahydrobiopterin dehydratase n=1 Tax=Amborella trichopoda TaxID=13333 RepID=U5CW78_AMBTC|nr:uncharacterized protein LOC18442456 [Amborella trichopoda]ERN14200.1 hypothetical protein AMTR_s00033p00092970 [Amborella trichopoda]|eukprot:XP_006852733.1 uncharacterized protein LOC18442456 [Amborella trichopoda]